MDRRVQAILLAFFLAAFAAPAAQSCAAVGKTGVGEEIFIAGDIGRGGRIFGPRLCGNKGVLIKGDNIGPRIGTEFIDFTTKERVRISPTPEKYMGCSPDDRWALYADRVIVGYDPSRYEYMQTDVVTLYRHEIATGKKERVALIRSQGDYNAVSPDGKKIFLGVKHGFSKKVYVNEWREVRLADVMEVGKVVWFPDSSGVAWAEEYPVRLCVEFIDKGGWRKCFGLDSLIGYKYDFTPQIAIDGKNNIYLLARRDPASEGVGDHAAYRCGFKDRALSCKRIAELDGMIHADLDFLPDGDLVFYNRANSCISRFSQGWSRPKCVVDDAYLTGVTQDGRWLVYHRSKRKVKVDDELSPREYYLYLRELHND